MNFHAVVKLMVICEIRESLSAYTDIYYFFPHTEWSARIEN
jgi:hypothetical protein